MLESRNDGKVVNGNFNPNGNLNVNRNLNADNHNPNLGGRSSVVGSCYLSDFLQPPSILPISCRACSSWRYFLLSRACISLASLTSILRRSKEAIDFSSIGNFLSGVVVPAAKTCSKIIKARLSIFCPRVKRSFLGKSFKLWYKSK